LAVKSNTGIKPLPSDYKRYMPVNFKRKIGDMRLNKLTNEQLREMEERCKKATPGGWKIFKDEHETRIGTNWIHGQLKSYAPVVTTTVSVKRGTCVYIKDADAEFIAHAREDMPILIAEVIALRNELSLLCPIAVYDLITSLRIEKEYMMEHIADLDAEVKRLRYALDNLKDYAQEALNYAKT
jgi:hypothetical protein